MSGKRIVLKQRRDLGDAISAYFEFFKIHLKPFLNIFLRYNGIFILGFLLVSYLLVTGYLGFIKQASVGFYSPERDTSHELFIGLGFLGFLGMFLVTSVLNYGLGAAYVKIYQQEENEVPDKKKVWSLFYNKFGSILLFVIMSCLLLVIYLIVYVIIAFIPVIGFFAQIFSMYFLTSWLGVSFAYMLDKDKNVFEALGHGWNLVFKHLIKSVVFNLSVGFLLTILTYMVMMIPGVLVGIYSYHSIETSEDIMNSPFTSIVWTLAVCIYFILIAFGQSLLQMANGILYYALQEQTYNEAVRQRIEQIGARD